MPIIMYIEVVQATDVLNIFFSCSVLLLCQGVILVHGSYRNPSFFPQGLFKGKSGFQGHSEINCSTIPCNNTGHKHR